MKLKKKKIKEGIEIHALHACGLHIGQIVHGGIFREELRRPENYMVVTQFKDDSADCVVHAKACDVDKSEIKEIAGVSNAEGGTVFLFRRELLTPVPK